METILAAADLSAIWLTVKLATVVTVILLLIGTPIAWWLSRTRSAWKGPVGALVAAAHRACRPRCSGFYLLVTLGPNGPIGHLTQSLGLGVLPFTFAGLVVGSVLYSMPFVVQPLQNAFEAIGERPLEVAATLRAAPLGYLLQRGAAARETRFPHRDHPRFRAHRRRIRRGADDRRQHSRQDPGGLGADLRSRRGDGIHPGALAVGGHGAVLVPGAAGAVYLEPGPAARMSIRARFRIAHPGFRLDVDLQLPGRGVTALFGASGSGKTTCCAPSPDWSARPAVIWR